MWSNSINIKPAERKGDFVYSFREIWGYAPQVEQLRRAARSGRASHAYLFTGGAGAGKRLLAKTFAKALQCENPAEAPCGHCPSCLAFEHGNHPDVIYPRSEKKSFGVEEMREQIVETVDLKPYRYEKKIYILEKADTLTPQAQNAFLKTLEEPPAYAVFLLLAERQEAFLPTILSRVAQCRLRPLSEETVAAYLRQEKGLSAEESSLYAAYAQGRIGQALALMQEEAFRQMREDILEKMQALPSLSEGEAYLLAKDWEIYKNDLRFLDIIELWYRDLLAAKCLRDERFLIQKDIKDAIFRNTQFSAANLAKKAAAVRLARQRLLQNANFRLTMEVMLMECKESKE